MMTLEAQLMDDMKTAMKAHDMETLQVIRFLRSTIQNAQIDGAGNTDGDLQKIIASQVKKSKEAVNEFEAAGRSDLAAQEKAKIQVMEKYLPQQLSEAQLDEVVKKIIAEASDTSNSGRLVGQVMKQVAGQCDGARVKAAVERLLAK